MRAKHARPAEDGALRERSGIDDYDPVMTADEAKRAEAHARTIGLEVDGVQPEANGDHRLWIINERGYRVMWRSYSSFMKRYLARDRRT